MSQRSLRLSLDYLTEARKKKSQKGWTQKQLADFAGCSTQPLSNFLNGKPVDRSIFIAICKQLDLEPKIVTESASSKPN